MFRVVLLIALYNICLGVSVGPVTAKNPSSGLTTSVILTDWQRAHATDRKIASNTSETWPYSEKIYEKLPVQDSVHVLKPKADTEDIRVNNLDHKLFLEKDLAQLNKISIGKIHRTGEVDGKIRRISESVQNKDIDEFEEFSAKINELVLMEESDSSEPSDEVMIPAILYKLKVFSTALCSEWNHKFAVFKAFVMISCLAIGFVAMITLLVYFFDIRKRQNNYMKLKLLA